MPVERVMDLLAALMIGAALRVALQHTNHLLGPFDSDQFRDIAQAQAVRDGHWLSDPYYAGQWAWYNPLLSWVIAGVAAIRGVGVEQTYVSSGPWLNLLGPIAFYAVGARLAGRAAALIGLAGSLLFVAGDWPSWATPTYSPWLFTVNFAQGLFFVAIGLFAWADCRPTPGRAAAVGAWLGVVFLAHMAPAAILAVLVALRWCRRSHWRFLAVAATAALLVSTPFLYCLATYHFHVVNAAPLEWQFPEVAPASIGRTALRFAPLLLLGNVGAWLQRRSIVARWWIVAAVMLVYALWPITPIVPAFHFGVYALAALLLLAGAAIARVVPRTWALAGVSIVVWAYWPNYAGRPDLKVGRDNALARSPADIAAVQTVRAMTRDDDVVLGTDLAVNRYIGPAGRHVLALDPLYSSPYVDPVARIRDRDRMLQAIRERDRASFDALAHRWNVSAFVLSGAELCLAAGGLFPETHQLSGGLCVASDISR
jgi:hypothetical protein